MIRLTLLAAVAFAAAPTQAATYTFEPQHTQGVISWNHLGFANPTAQFNNVAGTLDFDQADPTHAAVMVTIPLTLMSTGVADLNDDFKSADFFDFAKFPTATFKSTRVEKGAAPDTFRVTGDLSLRGTVRPVTLDVTLNKLGTNPRNNVPTVGFEAMATLKRSDFGLGLYVPQVSDEIRIHITAEAAEKNAYEQYLKAQAARAAAKKAKQ
ncbi:MAG TPA: YceI family protein [Steroidobacteraceae bacterium]|jgi:polyisoprenoid-binding protein YceI